MLSGSLVVLLDRGLVDLDVLGLNDRDNLRVHVNTALMKYLGATDPLLELVKIRWAECISLGDHGDQVDTRTQPLHDFDIKRLEGVASWADEVQADVHAKIDLVLTARLLLLQHVGLMLIIEELDDRHP